MTFENCLKNKIIEVEEKILEFLPSAATYQEELIEAMNYSVSAGGKRVRPLLMKEVFEHFAKYENLKSEQVEKLSDALLYFMAAIEFIHTYSLVHDDLPAMDNDMYRRGKETTHYKYGEAIGILAGDGLLNYAFELVAKAFDMVDAGNTKKFIKAFQILSQKAGAYGMIGGQTCDILSESSQERISKEQILFIHKNKTAALIEAAMMIGGIFAGCNDDRVKDIEAAGYDIGLAFQIQDDILDVTSTFETLGKPIGSDLRNNKQTYISVYGIEHATAEVERLSNEAIKLLSLKDDDFLHDYINYLIHRNK